MNAELYRISLNRIVTIAFVLFAGGQIVCSNAQVIVSEAMPVPKSGEPEWIELHNCSDSAETLSGWTVSDLKTPKALPLIKIQADEYILLSPDTSALKAARKLPEGCRLFQIKLSSLNNDGDAIVLRNSASIVIDSINYTKSQARKGISLERRYCEPSADNPLCICTGADSCSAGRLNSVSDLPFDAACLILPFRPGDNPVVCVINRGSAALENVVLKVLSDRPAGDNPVWTGTIGNLAPYDTAFETIPVNDLNRALTGNGFSNLTAIVYAANDRRADNDTSRAEYYKPASTGSVTINEFLTNADSTFSEFVELASSASESVDLGDWYIRRRTLSHNDTLRLPRGIVLNPGEIKAFSADSSLYLRFPELINRPEAIIIKSSIDFNKTSDEIYLCDPRNVAQDSVAFDETFFPANRPANASLEKIHPTAPSPARNSWRMSCADRLSTPGSKNCAEVEQFRNTQIKALPNPFRPTSGAKDGECVLEYDFGEFDCSVSISIFDLSGAIIAEPETGTPSNGKGFSKWDGRGKDGLVSPPGGYMLKIKCVPLDNTHSVIESKILLVIAE